MVWKRLNDWLRRDGPVSLVAMEGARGVGAPTVPAGHHSLISGLKRSTEGQTDV